MSSSQTTPIAVPFYKLSPGGNPTLLVPAAALPAGISRAAAAAALMDADHLGAEQVGFISQDAEPPRLDMMGGEFCVNACRAAALLFARMEKLSVVEVRGTSRGPVPCAWAGQIAASGCAAPLLAEARMPPGGPCSAAVALPLPPVAAIEEPEQGCALVRLPGIVHLLLDTATHPLPPPPDGWRKAARDLRARHGLGTEEAVGVIWHEPVKGEDARRIHPAVWVRDTDSLVMETACGSGSLALALLIRKTLDRDAVTVRQISGRDLQARFEPGLAWIDGPVILTAEGTAYL